MQWKEHEHGTFSEWILFVISDIIENPCSPNMCLNGATCVAGEGGYSFTCTCAPGFTGHLCDIDNRETTGEKAYYKTVRCVQAGYGPDYDHVVYLPYHVKMQYLQI